LRGWEFCGLAPQLLISIVSPELRVPGTPSCPRNSLVSPELPLVSPELPPRNSLAFTPTHTAAAADIYSIVLDSLRWPRSVSGISFYLHP
jgi:hypothetical protein